MNEIICPYCKEYQHLEGYCANRCCPRFHNNEIQSANDLEAVQGSLCPSIGVVQAYYDYMENVAPLVLNESQMEENLHLPLYLPNLAVNGQNLLPECEQEYRNFNNSLNIPTMERNAQENSRNSASQSNSSQGKNSNFYGPSTSQENSASGSVSTSENDALMRIAPSLPPVVAPLAVREFQFPHLEGFQGNGSQPGINVPRERFQQLQNTLLDLEIINIENPTQQLFAGVVTANVENEPLTTQGNEMCASGSQSTAKNIEHTRSSHSLHEPEAGASSANSYPGTSSNHNSTGGVSAQ
ncbi:Hypothetical predicted protein [Cloeon dipterum]|uniref:Uncharacterized protein n=1 Tax=Cloeon dipterum TaxID=197152 RepID=A0A8S1DBX4_9INSE|nr:Hypothetical predicted protein [Cloeon dipterum]